MSITTVLSPLCELMIKHNTDKSPKYHNYSPIYYELFKDIQFSALNIFEMGIGHNDTSYVCNMSHVPNYTPGSSLRVWRDFFPNAVVHGADLNQEAVDHAVSNQILTYRFNQLESKQISNLFATLPEFEVIIDDGFHDIRSNTCFFENTIRNLKENGIYIIEDVQTKQLEIFKETIKKWKTIHNKLKFRLFNVFSKNQTCKDNNYLVIISASFSTGFEKIVDELNVEIDF
jgi:hypothetical protein